MNVDQIIERCENQPATEERKLIGALARELKRLQGKGKTKGDSGGGES